MEKNEGGVEVYRTPSLVLAWHTIERIFKGKEMKEGKKKDKREMTGLTPKYNTSTY